MAKKKEVAKNPVVSNIPLPISDTPLVIDLPDGQKLVIGKMSQGSVIEVATWRGTGRPDSRTSRLMLGMNNAAAVSNTNTSEPASIPEPAKVFNNNKVDIKALLKKVDIQPMLEILKKLKSKAPKSIQITKKTQPEEFTSNVDIDEWLAKISTRAVAKHASPSKHPTKSGSKKVKKPVKRK